MLTTSLNKYYGRADKYDIDHIGIEVELEGKNLCAVDNLKLWSIVQEGSLRNGGVEYVTKIGCSVSNLDAYMAEYEKATSKAKIIESLRTSVHVHVCVQKLTLFQIYTVISAWFLLEDLLVSVNGPTRVGNLFCLRGRDAEGLQQQILEEVKQKNYFRSWTSNQRYAALNLAALPKSGTLEFRFIKGTHKPDEIQMWARALAMFVKRASRFEVPKNLLDFYQDSLSSSGGYKNFVRYFFKDEPLFLSFLEKTAPYGIHTDNEHLGFVLVLSTMLHTPKKKNLGLKIVEDIDELSPTPKKNSNPKLKLDLTQPWNEPELAELNPVAVGAMTADTPVPPAPPPNLIDLGAFANAFPNNVIVGSTVTFPQWANVDLGPVQPVGVVVDSAEVDLDDSF